jgi:hypothetical protein
VWVACCLLPSDFGLVCWRRVGVVGCGFWCIVLMVGGGRPGLAGQSHKVESRNTHQGNIGQGQQRTTARERARGGGSGRHPASAYMGTLLCGYEPVPAYTPGCDLCQWSGWEVIGASFLRAHTSPYMPAPTGSHAHTQPVASYLPNSARTWHARLPCFAKMVRSPYHLPQQGQGGGGVGYRIGRW